MPNSLQDDMDNLAVRAKHALEHVCSGANIEPASRYYSPTFVDHVNDMEFHGLEGAQESVQLYKKIFSKLEIRVKEQVIQGNQVASRFVVTGTSYGRAVHFNGITMSRFEKGMIVEDWSLTDTLGMLRQLGWWRTILIGIRSWKDIQSKNSYRTQTHERTQARGAACCR